MSLNELSEVARVFTTPVAIGLMLVGLFFLFVAASWSRAFARRVYAIPRGFADRFLRSLIPLGRISPLPGV